jgi:hypothetical protein
MKFKYRPIIHQIFYRPKILLTTEQHDLMANYAFNHDNLYEIRSNFIRYSMRFDSYLLI